MLNSKNAVGMGAGQGQQRSFRQPGQEFWKIPFQDPSIPLGQRGCEDKGEKGLGDRVGVKEEN